VSFQADNKRASFSQKRELSENADAYFLSLETCNRIALRLTNLRFFRKYPPVSGKERAEIYVETGLL